MQLSGRTLTALPPRTLPPEAAAAATERARTAIERCNQLIGWYEKRLLVARRLYIALQVTVILLTASIPMTAMVFGFPVWQAGIAVAASLAATLLATFKWKEDWIRYTISAEALRSELIKFQTRTTQDYAVQLAEDKALDNFVFRIENLASSEIAEWRAQLAQKATMERPNAAGRPPGQADASLSPEST